MGRLKLDPEAIRRATSRVETFNDLPHTRIVAFALIHEKPFHIWPIHVRRAATRGADLDYNHQTLIATHPGTGDLELHPPNQAHPVQAEIVDHVCRLLGVPGRWHVNGQTMLLMRDGEWLRTVHGWLTLCGPLTVQIARIEHPLPEGWR